MMLEYQKLAYIDFFLDQIRSRHGQVIVLSIISQWGKYLHAYLHAIFTLTNERYTLAVHDRLSSGLRGKTGFPEWGKTGL